MSARRSESGLTLTEVAVVIVLASVVMTGLVVFYLNAQTLWIDGFSQAMTQRELTLALRTIGRNARVSTEAFATLDPRVDLHLELRPPGADPDSIVTFWLADSVLHHGYPYASDPARVDLGPVIQSRVRLFAVHTEADMVYVDSICALTPHNRPITLSSSFALMNRMAP